MQNDNSRHYASRSSLTRRKDDRRSEERRTINYPFGSKEWLENISNHYLVWPKYDRRDGSRREHERRSADRRQRQLLKQHRVDQDYLQSVLTREERIMIQDLISH
jgi:hypothetical protein